MTILKFIFVALEVVVLFNVLIIVHELGHYLAARWRGLVVEKFGIWFGKPLWKKTINGVEYSLGCIPAGGFVALPQMAPMETIEGKSDLAQKPLPPVAPLDKIIVAFAGPLFSFSLAVFFACVVWVVGRPISEADSTTVVGYVLKESDSYKKGLRPGDRILEVDGQPVTKFNGTGASVLWRVVASEGDTISLTVDRQGQTLVFDVVPEKFENKSWFRRASLRDLPIEPKSTPMVNAVMLNSPADIAGIQKNDFITQLNGHELLSKRELSEYIDATKGAPFRVTVQRGVQSFDADLQPTFPVVSGPKTEKPRLMIGVEWEAIGKMTITHPMPKDQILASVRSVVDMLGALFSQKSDVKVQHLSGPLGIMNVYYHMFQSPYGWQLALWFSVLVNVNLAIMNMLPIPVLDGGHITMAIVEWVRRKPMNLQLLEFVQTACAILIMGFIAYVSFYDVVDRFVSGDSKAPEVHFAPPAPKP
jgi:regulator of sigma E protease